MEPQDLADHQTCELPIPLLDSFVSDMQKLATELLLHVLMEDQSQKNQQALPFSYTTCLLRIAKYQSEDFVWKPGTLFDILEDKDCCEGEVL